MQRTAHPAVLSFNVQRVGDRNRVRIQLDDRAKLWPILIDRINALGVKLNEPARGIAAARHRVLKLRDGEFVERKRSRTRSLLAKHRHDGAGRECKNRYEDVAHAGIVSNSSAFANAASARQLSPEL